MGGSREGGDAREHVCSRCITTALLTCWSVITTARRYLINAIVSFKNSHSRRRRLFSTFLLRLQLARGWKVDAAGIIGRETQRTAPVDAQLVQSLRSLPPSRSSIRDIETHIDPRTSPSRDTPPASASPKRDATAADIDLTL